MKKMVKIRLNLARNVESDQSALTGQVYSRAGRDLRLRGREVAHPSAEQRALFGWHRHGECDLRTVGGLSESCASPPYSAVIRATVARGVLLSSRVDASPNVNPPSCYAEVCPARSETSGVTIGPQDSANERAKAITSCTHIPLCRNTMPWMGKKARMRCPMMSAISDKHSMHLLRRNGGSSGEPDAPVLDCH